MFLDVVIQRAKIREANSRHITQADLEGSSKNPKKRGRTKER